MIFFQIIFCKEVKLTIIRLNLGKLAVHFSLFRRFCIYLAKKENNTQYLQLKF